MRNRIDFVENDLEDLSCHTGTTFIVDIRLVNNCSGIPDDLTGYTARLVIFDTDETTIIATIAGTITTPENGLINFTIPASQTTTFTEGMYSHHIEILIDTRVDRIGYGDFEVTK